MSGKYEEEGQAFIQHEPQGIDVNQQPSSFAQFERYQAKPEAPLTGLDSKSIR